MDALPQKNILQAAAVAERLQEFTTAGFCFSRCVEVIKSRLNNAEKTCLWNCAQRWEETRHFINMRSRDLITKPHDGDLRPTDSKTL
ncbi:putative tim10/DDP zinc finger domain-containing protein [Neospora caninum Liverpool]|uniref:Mitochondrial import inner membrane translocase subunit n=1 Tax=Neospora caninum (strain Liverpool) TaxID=572307 RepID=F0VIL7_NEOCL|nr:putative tim10/DDP zinc finger domain-containing protein [Neospora caninum Liverpool]CBZ53578.1 putative tim10/DDP zinc finger domain-containing protein [Neospora caninum Liverpool]CEL67566.1 TPA: tim10/DDP zinc finger domain-containing protein,putative [Neospora caninum Liverpool]|eukprot:XP_003883610.1 putative tim10/DDP zinc finger domain-containing protein [Neospora caninum Liverpool]